MWGRVIEMSLAVWLGLSPFIFQVHTDARLLWTDLCLAALILSLAALSYWFPTRHAHLLSLFVAIGMIAWGRFSTGTPPLPIEQNHIFIGLLLSMIAIIPNHASQPPLEYRHTQ